MSASQNISATVRISFKPGGSEAIPSRTQQIKSEKTEAIPVK